MARLTARYWRTLAVHTNITLDQLEQMTYVRFMEAIDLAKHIESESRKGG